MNQSFYAESKVFPDASLIKQRTKLGHSELCFISLSFFAMVKCMTVISPWEIVALPQTRPNFLSEGVTTQKKTQNSSSYGSMKHIEVSWEDYCQAAFPPRRESEVQVVHAWHHKILLWQQLTVYLIKHHFGGQNKQYKYKKQNSLIFNLLFLSSSIFNYSLWINV